MFLGFVFIDLVDLSYSLRGFKDVTERIIKMVDQELLEVEPFAKLIKLIKSNEKVQIKQNGDLIKSYKKLFMNREDTNFDDIEALCKAFNSNKEDIAEFEIEFLRQHEPNDLDKFLFPVNIKYNFEGEKSILNSIPIESF